VDGRCTGLPELAQIFAPGCHWQWCWTTGYCHGSRWLRIWSAFCIYASILLHFSYFCSFSILVSISSSSSKNLSEQMRKHCSHGIWKMRRYYVLCNVRDVSMRIFCVRILIWKFNWKIVKHEFIFILRFSSYLLHSNYKTLWVFLTFRPTYYFLPVWQLVCDCVDTDVHQKNCRTCKLVPRSRGIFPETFIESFNDVSYQTVFPEFR